MGSTILIIALLCVTLTGCTTQPTAKSNYTTNQQVNNPGLAEISLHAISLVGIPYRYGGNTPTAGFDCSGLIRYVVKRAIGMRLPRTLYEIRQHGTPLAQENLAPGDLVFFNTNGKPDSHAGIYVGKGRFVHAPSTGGRVRLEQLNTTYWATRFTQARRLSPS